MKLTEYPGIVGKLEVVDCGNHFSTFEGSKSINLYLIER